MKSRKKRLREVYVWELPVRIYHWLNALCIVILCITGFIIADPLAIMTETEANFSYWFGTVRFIHFVAAFVFFFNFVFRLYWGFVGNRYARWNNFIPLKKSQWKEILEVIKVDILMIKNLWTVSGIMHWQALFISAHSGLSYCNPLRGSACMPR